MFERVKQIFGVAPKSTGKSRIIHGKFPMIKNVVGGGCPVTFHGITAEDKRPEIMADAAPSFDMEAFDDAFEQKRESLQAGDDNDVVFSWDDFSRRCDEIAAEAIVREQNKPWEPDGEYEYPSE